MLGRAPPGASSHGDGASRRDHAGHFNTAAAAAAERRPCGLRRRPERATRRDLIEYATHGAAAPVQDQSLGLHTENHSYVMQGVIGAAESWIDWAGFGAGAEQAVDGADEVAFEGAHGFSAGLAFAAAAGDVFAGGPVEAGLGERDHVQGGVELAVAGAVEAVSLLAA